MAGVHVQYSRTVGQLCMSVRILTKTMRGPAFVLAALHLAKVVCTVHLTLALGLRIAGASFYIAFSSTTVPS